jgi:serine protease AprX
MKWIQRASYAVTLGLMVLASDGVAYAHNGKYDEVIERMLKEGRDDLPVIVRYKDDASMERGKRKALKGQRAQLGREMKRLRAMGMTVDRATLLELLKGPDVERISYDAPVASTQTEAPVAPPPPLPVGIDSSGSSAARSRYGVIGSGTAVAVIDSGVQPHDDLPLTRITAFVDFVNGRTEPYDDYGHGTHVAGIIAGDGKSSSGQYTGVAPAAKIVALKVLDGRGAGTTSNVLAALEWVLANGAGYNVRVVNLSLGHPIYEPAATDPLVQMVEALSRRGFLVVVSAGNMGRNALGQTVYGSITSPANAQSAIAVGAANANGTLVRSDDTVPAFSSRGPTRYDRYAKPDVLAPGYAIVSTAAPDSYLLTTYPHLQVGTGYMRLNGTSMAAPVVSGAATLVWEANPTLTAHTVKALVQFTAQRMPVYDVMTQGAGQVNLAGAVRFARLIIADRPYDALWVKANRKPIRTDHLFGEKVFWGQAITWGQRLGPTNAVFMRLAMWDDNIVWGFDDNIVWGFDDNIVWGFGMTDWVESHDDNLVWGLNDDNIVWGFDDNIVWGFDDNIVWSFNEDILWGVGDNIVWSFAEETLVVFSDSVDGLSILTGEVQ